ncbi:MAG: hypothetical protein Q8K63_02005 [Acidimicrobiales bacterium]|nr:hypothetical protein [Acidimicrobiales bacterium]
MRVGVKCHHVADAVFHDLPVFLDGSRALTRDLLERGVPRGAARAIGHAGWELLLDGLLVEDHALMADYFAALRVGVADDDWRAALDRRAARGVPTFYAEPAHVAELLRRILSYRPRLTFGVEHRGDVVAALGAAQPGVAASADAVFAAVMPAGE